MKKLFISSMVALGVLFGFGGLAYAVDPTDAARNQVCQGINEEAGGNCDTGGEGVDRIVATLLNILSYIAGIAAVIMIIVSGLKYITAGGDSSKVSSAKTTLIYAIVGIIVVALAQIIVNFVLGEVI